MLTFSKSEWSIVKTYRIFITNKVSLMFVYLSVICIKLSGWTVKMCHRNCTVANDRRVYAFINIIVFLLAKNKVDRASHS